MVDLFGPQINQAIDNIKFDECMFIDNTYIMFMKGNLKDAREKCDFFYTTFGHPNCPFSSQLCRRMKDYFLKTIELIRLILDINNQADFLDNWHEFLRVCLTINAIHAEWCT